LNIRRFLDHRRQSLDDLIFRGKQHPQLVTIKAPQGLKVGREEFHLLAPFFGCVLMAESTSGGFNKGKSCTGYSNHRDHWAFPMPAGPVVRLWTYLFKF
jgi:hypothetical protein